MNTLNPARVMDLSHAPWRVRVLPKDKRGFPVPWFVAWFKDGKTVRRGAGEPDFRIVAEDALTTAFKGRRCWVCGQALGNFEAVVIGPMCTINRVTSEPGSHYDCARFSAETCPFLTKPRMRRNEKALPEHSLPGGIHLDRNPGATALWVMKMPNRPDPFRVPASDGEGMGTLFALPEPDRVEWFAEGRPATRAEVLIAIASGMPFLRELAEKDGPEAVAALYRAVAKSREYLPNE